MTTSVALEIAFQAYQTGNLSQAESICHQILQQEPNHTGALHLLGVIAHQLGKLPQAIIYYQQTIVLGAAAAEVYYSLGAALHASGQLQEAIANYQQAIALKPDYAEVHYDLGYALQEQGHLSIAIEHYQQAISLNPNDPEARGNLANALLAQGQVDLAIAHYQQIVALRPNDAGIYYNLGNAFKQQGKLEAAITHYRWTLALAPNYTDAYLQLAASLHSSDQLEEALFYYRQAIFLNPNLANVYYEVGSILTKQGKHSEAIIPYQQALALDPNLLDAYIGLGCSLFDQFRLEEATACFQQSLRLNPDLPEAYYNLGIAFANQSQADAAIDCFQTALQLKPDFVEAYWHNQLLLPILYDTQKQISWWRQRFCRGLNSLIQQTASNTSGFREQALRGLEKSRTTFYLSYQGLKDRGVQHKYGKFVHQVMAASYPQWASPVPMPQLSRTNKIRVGYICAYFREHSIARTTIGWLKNRDQQSFEIYTYHIGNQIDSVTQEFCSYSDKFYHIYGDLEAVCQQAIADQLDILVFAEIGLDPLTNRIAGLRLAPVQCTTLGHPVTSGLPTIDYYLSSDLMEPENAQLHYLEKLVRLPNIGVCYEKPLIPELTKTRSHFHLREQAIIYLSSQSLFKYLPQFDYIFAQIAQRVPQAQFAFISSHATAITAQFKSRLQHAFARFGLNSQDFCVFLPRLERVDYFNLNLVSHIFLDPFSWSAFNTTLEAIACGLPVVTCPTEFMRSRHSYGILKMMGAGETLAQNEAEYVEIAVRLGLDDHWRQDIIKQIYACHNRLYNDKACVMALESFYKSVVQQDACSSM